MKKITALFFALLTLLPVFTALGASATAVEVENASKPAVVLECNDVTEGNILIVTVSLSGCADLTSADLRFEYDPSVLTYMGGSLRGAAAGDRNITAVLSERDDAAENGYVSLSMFHLDKFSVPAGNSELCELAFRAGSGRCTVKARSVTFRINEEEVKPSLGKCSYSSGMGSFFAENGSTILVFAVIGVVLIVLIVLLVIIRRIKKNMKSDLPAVNEPVPFEEEEIPFEGEEVLAEEGWLPSEPETPTEDNDTDHNENGETEE